ncbi:MAG: GerMN domain-containing protein, partial [Nitrospinota bacterium]|nr:GerMN domain-containing protein [Nitrospinota bacterium]
MKRSRRWPWFFALLLLGAGGSFYYQDKLSDFIADLVERSRIATFGEPEKAPSLAPTVSVDLYFVSPEGEKLVRVQREVDEGGATIETLRRALEALIAGPVEGDSASPSVPP